VEFGAVLFAPWKSLPDFSSIFLDIFKVPIFYLLVFGLSSELLCRFFLFLALVGVDFDLH
jgi:hypothetical protein